MSRERNKLISRRVVNDDDMMMNIAFFNVSCTTKVEAEAEGCCWLVRGCVFVCRVVRSHISPPPPP